MKSDMLKHPLVRSTQRILLERKIFTIEFFERMNKLRSPVINDRARNTTKRPLPNEPMEIRDVERPLDAKQSADSSAVEKIQL